MIELEPGDQWSYVRLAFLLFQTGDVGGYRSLCERIKARFGNTADPQAAHQVATASLVLSEPGADLTTESRLAEVAVTAGKGHPNEPTFQLSKGLLDYRQGRFASAEDWVARSLAATNSWHEEHVAAYMVLAMTRHQLKQTDRAGDALAKGLELALGKLPTIQSGDIGENWVEWIIARALVREAKSLIQGSSNTRD